MRKGELVVRKSVSNARLSDPMGWTLSHDKPLLVVRGMHEAFVSWSDRVTVISVAIDVMDPETGEVYHSQPICDFEKILR